MINDNEQQEKELINLKRRLDIFDTADAQHYLKMIKPRNTTEVKEKMKGGLKKDD